MPTAPEGAAVEPMEPGAVPAAPLGAAAVESIEADLTTELDDRLTRLAESTGAATSRALDHVADRIGDQSADAVTVGMKELLAVIDRRFAWLEEMMHERLASLERAMGTEFDERTVLPQSERIVTVDTRP